MRITIVIDDADATAATEAAQTMGRAFVRSGGSSVRISRNDSDPPAAVSAPVIDVDVGAAPRLDVGGPAPVGSTSGSGRGQGPAGDRPQPPKPSSPAHPAAESAGAAPDLGGGSP